MTKKLEILIVEDSLTQALLLQEALEKHQLYTTLAKNGIEALECLSQSLPNVVISDIEMPIMGGYELCKQIKLDPKFKEIPVILLTSLSDPLEVINSIECYADAFLTKPCNVDFLLSTMNSILENRKLRKQNGNSKELSFVLMGKPYHLAVDPIQVTDLLLSTYLNAIQKNSELEDAYRKLNSVYAEIRHKNQELKELNEQKNQFLGMAAHDLRNPLGVITGFSDILMSKLKESIDEKSLKMIDLIQKSSTFMLTLINDLLDFSVIESGTVTLRLEELNFSELIQESILVNKDVAEKKNIKLDFQDAAPKIIINGDRSKLFQVINNLLTNATKFSQPGSNIDIMLKATDEKITFSVQDHGTGIPAKAQETLFQPFSKGSASGTAGEKCTGLGLAIVHKIVTEHKGKIWFKSQVGEGSTFFVSLPLSNSPNAKL